MPQRQFYCRRFPEKIYISATGNIHSTESKFGYDRSDFRVSLFEDQMVYSLVTGIPLEGVS